MVSASSLFVAAINTASVIATAAIFGASQKADVLLTALTLALGVATPLVSSLDAVYLPRWSSRGELDRTRMARDSSAWFILAFALMGALAWAMRPVWLPMFLMGYEGASTDLDPIVILAAAAFTLSGAAVAIQRTVLVADRRFGAIAFATLPPPFCSFVALFALHGWLGTLSPLWGLVTGNIVALAITVRAAKLSKILSVPSLRSLQEFVAMVVSYVPVAIAAALFAFVPIALRALASQDGIGGLSSQYYAERIFLLPHTILTVSVASVVMPFLVGNRRGDSEIMGDVSIYGLLLLGPISVLLLVYAEDLAAVALQRGSFTAAATVATAGALRGYAFGLVPLFVVTIGWRLLQARALHSAVVIVSLAYVVGTLAIAPILYMAWGLAGIGGANSLGASAAMVAVLVIAARTNGAAALLGRMRSLLLAAGALSVMFVAAVLAFGQLSTVVPSARLAVGSVASILVYCLAVAFLRRSRLLLIGSDWQGGAA